MLFYILNICMFSPRLLFVFTHFFSLHCCRHLDFKYAIDNVGSVVAQSILLVPSISQSLIRLQVFLRTVHKVVTVLYAITVWTLPVFKPVLAILERPGTFCLDLMSSVFLETVRSQMKRWRFSVYYRFVYSFSRSFQLIQLVFSYRKISILR